MEKGSSVLFFLILHFLSGSLRERTSGRRKERGPGWVWLPGGGFEANRSPLRVLAGSLEFLQQSLCGIKPEKGAPTHSVLLLAHTLLVLFPGVSASRGMQGPKGSLGEELNMAAVDLFLGGC